MEQDLFGFKFEEAEEADEDDYITKRRRGTAPVVSPDVRDSRNADRIHTFEHPDLDRRVQSRHSPNKKHSDAKC